jgi:hypothetical protein
MRWSSALLRVEVQARDDMQKLPEQARLRMEACKVCPHLSSMRFCMEGVRQSKCKCLLPWLMPAKVRLTGASCPIGKW